ncbi:DUF1003 domain-containing protein [Paraflavitalea soli]|uniref:DUF1003 domain-containing protein n=1 Tax=Paraflavitalea soli TaxID=2315862 RepID=A0A3B7MM00_9BACT|nr:DUF1003 domain-containing protein [Paraflavitalea soli]AXY75472.1 DUF1003 domain-containing protein [Paraflavitalea soli]
MAIKEIDSLITQEDDQLKKLQCIVEDTIKEEELINDNLLHPPSDILTPGQKISDKVARFGGSWKFIISFTIILVGWILYNILSPEKESFDPYPFILLNLVLSCIAAMQAPIIMMSQNRQEEKDRKRAENDYLVNLKAEMEVRSLQKNVDLLLQEQIKTLYDMQHKQLEMLKEICDKLNKKGS